MTMKKIKCILIKKYFFSVFCYFFILLSLCGNCMEEVTKSSSSEHEKSNGEETQQFYDSQDYDTQFCDGITDDELLFSFEYPPPQNRKGIKELPGFSECKVIAVFDTDYTHNLPNVSSSGDLAQVNTQINTGSSNELTHLILNGEDSSILNPSKTPLEILECLRFNTGKGKSQEISAFVICKGNRISNDERRFMQEIDRQFFRYANNDPYPKTGILFASFMWPTAFAASAATIYAIGNFLDIIKNSQEDWTFLVWNVLTHAPVYGRQFYQEAQNIAGWLGGTEPFQPQSGGDPFLPRTYQKSKSHYAAYASGSLAAFIHATTSLFFFYLAEKHYFYSFFVPTGSFLWVSEFMRNLSRIKRNIDQNYIRHYDDEEDVKIHDLHDDAEGIKIHVMRQHLVRQNAKFQKELHRDDFVSACYDYIGSDQLNSVKVDDDIQEDEEEFYFKISLLFLRDLRFFYNFDHQKMVKTEEREQKERASVILLPTELSNDPTEFSNHPVEKLNRENIKQRKKIKALNKEKENLIKEKESLIEEWRKTENGKTGAQSVQPSASREKSNEVCSATLYTASFARLAGMEYLLGTVFIAMVASQTCPSGKRA
jgi:hypothetical protein